MHLYIYIYVYIYIYIYIYMIPGHNSPGITPHRTKLHPVITPPGHNSSPLVVAHNSTGQNSLRI